MRHVPSVGIPFIYGGQQWGLPLPRVARALDDFAPDRVAQKVDPLRKLLELRGQLADLRGKVQSNEKLEEILVATLGDEEKRKKLQSEIEAERGSAGGPAGGKDGQS